MHGYSLVRGSGGPGEGSASPVPLPRQRGSRRRKAVVALVALIVVVQAAFAWYAWGFDAAESGAQTRSGAREEARRLWEQLALAAKHRLDAGKAAWLGDGSGLIDGATGSPSVGARFELPTTPLPVHHEHARIHFNNHPLSSHRPSAHQFLLDPSAASSGRLTQAPPVVAIVTATHNPRAVLLETAASLFGQSLQSFVWLVVDDHSSDRGARRRLREVARDPRVVLLRNEGQRGLSASRNVALRWILDKEARRRDGRRPRYVTNLDDDDLFELTALEKLVWMLESNPEWDLGGFQFVKFGASNETVKMGIHSGAFNFFGGNYVPGPTLVTTRAVEASGCLNDGDGFAAGGEDWDFFMCLAEHGYWGGTLPEPLFWYRVNPSSFRSSRWGDMLTSGGLADIKTTLHAKHPALELPSAFPDIPARASSPVELVVWDAPYDALLAPHDQSVLFLVRALGDDHAGRATLHQVRLFAERGYRVTVVATHYDDPAGLALRPFILQYTHDVHVLSDFLRATEFPRFIKHLVDSRGIRRVVLGGSALAYDLVPALGAKLPHVTFADYLADGALLASSLRQRPYLSLTLAASSYLRDLALEQQPTLDPASVVLCRPGVDLAALAPLSSLERAAVKHTLLRVGADVVVVLVDPLSSPAASSAAQLVAASLRQLGNYTAADAVFLLPETNGTASAVDKKTDALVPDRRSSEEAGLPLFRFPPANAIEAFATADVFLTLTSFDGYSSTVGRAMALSLPVVAPDAGAAPEQLGGESGDNPALDDAGGILVSLSSSEMGIIEAKAAALHALVRQPELRARLGAAARRKVETGGDWRVTLRDMVGQVELSRAGRGGLGAGPGEAESAREALEEALREQPEEIDFALVQASLKFPPRTGVGKDLQNHCGEKDAHLGRWIDNVVAAEACPDAVGDKRVLDVHALQRDAAIVWQCGSRCVFDLSTSAFAGWFWTGKCWAVLDEPKKECEGAWKRRVGVLPNATSSDSSSVAASRAPAVPSGLTMDVSTVLANPHAHAGVT